MAANSKSLFYFRQQWWIQNCRKEEKVNSGGRKKVNSGSFGKNDRRLSGRKKVTSGAFRKGKVNLINLAENLHGSFRPAKKGIRFFSQYQGSLSNLSAESY